MSEPKIAIVGLEDRTLGIVLRMASLHRSLEFEQAVHTRHVDEFNRMTMAFPPDPSTSTITWSSNYNATINDGWAGYAATTNWYSGFDYLAEQAAIEKAWKRRWQDYHSMRDATPYFYSKKLAPKRLDIKGFFRLPGLNAQRKAPFSPAMKAHKSFMKKFARSIRNVV